MQYVELIMFDLDGTLIDSREDIADAVNFTLRNLGLNEKSSSEVSSYIGKGVDNLLMRSLGDGNKKFFDEALILLKKFYREYSLVKTVLYPGVKQVLDYFNNKKKVIITNRNYEFAVLGLKAAGILGYFEEVIAADDVNCIKPSGCLLKKVLNKMNICKNRAIIVGDMDIDIIAGKMAGIYTCAVSYGIGKKEDILKVGPDYLIDDILQLQNIIYYTRRR